MANFTYYDILYLILKIYKLCLIKTLDLIKTMKFRTPIIFMFLDIVYGGGLN